MGIAHLETAAAEHLAAHDRVYAAKNRATNSASHTAQQLY
jgi:hypothetical protein